MSFKTFTLELKISDQCSMRCPYCYETFTDTYMTKEMFDSKLPEIIDLMQRSSTTNLNLSFFGGEPMMNFDLIKHATKQLRKLPIETNLVIISNMTLIDEEKLKWIQDNDVGVSWSFDGMGSDTSRPIVPQFINPKSNGVEYSSTMELYKDKMPLISQLTKGCKVMIWPGNMHEMSSNLDFFLEMGIPSPDFSIVRDDVWSRQNLIDFRGYIIELADKYIEYTKQGKYINIGFFSLAILDNIFGLTYSKRPFGCFAGVHGAVMTTDGKFYPCARFSDKKLLEIDKDFSFEYWAEKFKPENYDKCQTCEIKDVCNAGCSYSQLRNDNKPLDSVCELFFMIQEQAQRVVHELRDNKTFHTVIKNRLGNIG